MFLLFLPFWLRNMTKRLPISSNDFELFDAELNSYEYEYFCKHIGAFKRFMQEEPVEQRQLFLDAFCEYSYNHIEIKAIATMSDPKKKFIESFRTYAQETFINGKFSSAKQFLNDSVLVARNKHMIHYMDSHSYAKDPFFHKETRDVFRRLFGEPTEAGTCVKVICVLPLYVRFAGSICRYLKKWLDMEESLYPLPIKVKNKKDKKAMKEREAILAASKSKIVAVSHQTRPAASNPRMVSTGQQTASGIEKPKTISTGQQTLAVVKPSELAVRPAESVKQDGEDFSSFYYDMHERKKRKREVQRKGKKHEIACQHPCHGKTVCEHTGHPHSHTHDHAHIHEHAHSHDHCHDHTHNHAHNHDHDPSVPAATQHELMSCLCQKHRVLAEAKLAEKRAALEKQTGVTIVEDKTYGDKTSGDKSSDDKSSDDKISEDKSSTGADKISEDKSSAGAGKISEDKSSAGAGKISEDKSSVGKNESPEDKSSEDKNSDDIKSANKGSEEKNSEDKSSEDKSSEDKSSEDKSSEDKSSEDKSSGDKSSEDKSSVGKVSVDNISGDKISGDKTTEDKRSGEKNAGDKNVEDKESEGQTAESKDLEQPIAGAKKSDDDDLSLPELRSPRGKKMGENGVVSSDSSDDCDEAVERFVRKAFPELHLGEPHPNQQYKEMVAAEDHERAKEKLEERIERAKEELKETKLRTCAHCRKQETEMKTFKKCQKCKGKGTKFYCSRDCQKIDWTMHRLEH